MPKGPAALSTPLEGHRDCIWDVQVHPTQALVASASADGTVKLWASSGTERAPRITLRAPGDATAASSIAFLPNAPGKIVATYTNATAAVFDIETGQAVTAFPSASTYGAAWRASEGDGWGGQGDGADQAAVATAPSRSLDGTTATQINKVVVHPTLPLAITAHEDKYLRFFDTNTGTPRARTKAPSSSRR